MLRPLLLVMSAAACSALEWTRLVENAPWTARSFPCAGIVDDKLVMTGGHNDDGYNSEVWSSPDGIAWTLETVAPWTPRSYHSCEVLPSPDGDRLVIVGGHSENDWYGDVWISAPGNVSDWTQVLSTAPWPARAAGSLVLRDESLFFLAGSDGYMPPLGNGNLFNDVWRSDDGGASWVCVNEAAPFPAREGESGGTGVTLGGHITIIGGETGYFEESFLGDVWSSPDGEANWTEHTSLAEFSVAGYGRTGHVVSKQTTSVGNEILWLAAGFVSLSDVWCSSNLDDGWTQVDASSPWPGRYDFMMKVFKGALFVFAGEDSPQGYGGPFFADVWSAPLPEKCG